MSGPRLPLTYSVSPAHTAAEIGRAEFGSGIRFVVRAEAVREAISATVLSCRGAGPQADRGWTDALRRRTPGGDENCGSRLLALNDDQLTMQGVVTVQPFHTLLREISSAK